MIILVVHVLGAPSTINPLLGLPDQSYCGVYSHLGMPILAVLLPTSKSSQLYEQVYYWCITQWKLGHPLPSTRVLDVQSRACPCTRCVLISIDMFYNRRPALTVNDSTSSSTGPASSHGPSHTLCPIHPSPFSAENYNQINPILKPFYSNLSILSHADFISYHSKTAFTETPQQISRSQAFSFCSLSRSQFSQ